MFTLLLLFLVIILIIILISVCSIFLYYKAISSTKFFGKLDFRLAVIVHQSDESDLSFDVLLEQLADFFVPLGLRSVEIVKSNLVKYRLVGGKFVNCLDTVTYYIADHFPVHHGVDLTGTVELSCGDFSDVNNFLTYICNTDNFKHGLVWSFNDEFLDLYTTPFDGELSKRLNIASFAFGNIVNGNRFVSHLNDFQLKEGKFLVTASHISGDISYPDKKMVLEFDINHFNPHDRSSQQPTYSNQLLLTADYKSIKEIIVSVTNLSNLQIYIRLKNPPNILEKLSDSETLPIDWKDFPSLSREKIGRCKVVKLSVEITQDDTLQSTIGIIFDLTGVFPESSLSFAIVDEYFVDNEFTLDLSNYPFEIQYAIQCIYSISLEFHDDTFINRKLADFSILIDKHLIRAELTQTLILALHLLFADYATGVVINAYHRFKSLLAEASTIKKDTLVKTSKNTGVRQVILTPLRTIFLPPMQIKPNILVNNEDSDSLIRILFRHDWEIDFSRKDQLCFNETSGDCKKLMDNQVYRNYLLREIVSRRLINGSGFNVCDRTYKYSGTSVGQIFNVGIILTAIRPTSTFQPVSSPKKLTPISKVKAKLPTHLEEIYMT